MLLTLQQKLRIWTLISNASSATQEARDRDPTEEEPARLCQPSERIAPGQEFPDMASVHDDASSPASRIPSTVNNDQGDGNNFEAQPEEFDVAKGLLRSLNIRTLSPNSPAREATQDENAFALETPDQLLDYIRTAQERDVAYHATIALTRRQEGGATKAATLWEVDPSGVLRRNRKV
jgi:hypothetical protein